MKYNNLILLAVCFLVSGLVMGLSLNAYAQTSDLIRLDENNHYGQFSIDNVHVSEKDYYKLVFIDVHVKVKDLALEDFANVYWDSITLTNENGKKYYAEKNVDQDCNKKGFDGTFYEIQGVKGSEGGIGQHSLCYMVEKEFSNFKVYYIIPFNNPNNPYLPFQIGNIVLNQNNDPTFNGVSNPSATSNPSTSSTSQSTTNIFEQLMNWLKQIFHFVILGSPIQYDP